MIRSNIQKSTTVVRALLYKLFAYTSIWFCECPELTVSLLFVSRRFLEALVGVFYFPSLSGLLISRSFLLTTDRSIHQTRNQSAFRTKASSSVSREVLFPSFLTQNNCAISGLQHFHQAIYTELYLRCRHQHGELACLAPRGVSLELYCYD